jgi:MFS transporter, FSR family, fosmidomycin resistance protein
MQSRFGWRGAFVGAAILGVAVLALLLAQRPDADDRPDERARADARTRSSAGSPRHSLDWRLLLAPTIVVNLFFFVLISLMSGLNSFLVVALAALYGTSADLANVALTGLLLMNAFGVLLGGVLASRTTRHAAVAGLSLALAGIFTALIGIVGSSASALVLTASLSGLFIGITAPSRDMIVRAVTPPGAFGRVFGFVSSGFNIGSMIAPMIYATLMDRGEPRALFIFSAACAIVGIATVVFGLAGRERREAPV